MGLSQVSSALDLLVGYQVNLYVGDEAFKGKLIGVEEDHIILENENNYIFYYSIDQIQAITKNTKQFQTEEITSEFLQTQSMIDLLNSLKNTWVTILCLNKQKFNGVISEVDKHFVTLISGEEKVLIKLSHISNVLKGFIKENENSDQAENQDKNEETKQESHVEAVMYKEKEQLEERYSETEEKETKIWSQPIKASDDSPRESKNQMKKTEKEQPAEELSKPEEIETPIRMITDEKEKETKVWSQPIKANNEKRRDETTRKGKNEMKKVKDETTSYRKKEKESKNVVVVNESKNVHQKEDKQIVQKAVKEEKGNKEVNVSQKAESVNKGKDVLQPTFSIQPSTIKKEVTQSKNEDTREKEQVLRSFRFLGEPVTSREIDQRPSIFEGWPSRRNKPGF